MTKLMVIFILISGFGWNQAYCQSVSNIDITSVNVDELTDDQIRSYIQQAEARGFTQDQLENLARQRGMSEVQIAKLRRRVEAVRLSSPGGQAVAADNGLRTSPVSPEGDVFGNFGPSNSTYVLTEEQKKIFGFGLFRSDNLTFTPNLNIPTPQNYVIGPGDEISVDLWGATQQFFSLTVGAEGTVRPPELSPVYINGLTVKQAESKIIDRLSQIYGGIKGSQAQAQNIFYQVSLSNVRTINVTVVGEVGVPGNYSLNSLSTVFTALHAAGGPADDGTFRSIRLIRDNKLKTEVDLYDFLVEGLRPNDERLRDGDVIIVKLFETRVEVEGEVKRPGIYEVKAGESFKELIMKHAGGFSSSAYQAFITVDRNSETGKSVLNIPTTDLDQFEPKDGDLIKVRAVQERYENRVQIKGAVSLGGDYELTEGLTVKGLINNANGLMGDAYLDRATIFRTNPDFSQQTISFNLQELLAGEREDIELVNEDILQVFSIYDLQEEYYVEINGEVSIPGVLPYVKNMKVEDVILLAGGLKEGASGAQIEISRRNVAGSANSVSEIINLSINKNLSTEDGSPDIILEPFDQIFIRKVPNYSLQQKVTIEGEVSGPGEYAISRKDERISDIIKRAGGITPYAYPKGAILIRKTEFAEKKADSELNYEKLLALKEKILAMDTASASLSHARLKLVERLKLLMEGGRGEFTAESFDQGVGNRVKRELTEDLVAADSLATQIEISEEEPTVLELSNILENPGSKYDYFVKEGDIISIPPKLQTIRVAGEVISPLNLRYEKPLTFKDYITDAGGFTTKAKKGRSYVQYPNGKRRQTKRFLFFKFYPRIEPGSTIVVTRKPDRDKISLQEILAITSSLATITFLVDRISN